MPQRWFEEWAGRHGSIFGLNNEEMTAALAWEDLFTACGYVASELAEATDELAKNPSRISLAVGRGSHPGKMALHLAAIHGVCRDLKAVVYHRQTNEHERDRRTCTTCGGSGAISVPHLSGVTDGQWRPVKVGRASPTYYTCAVTCHCALGRWCNERRPANRRLPELSWYDAKNPAWQIQMARHKRELTERSRHSEGPETWEEAQRMLRDLFQVPEPELA